MQFQSAFICPLCEVKHVIDVPYTEKVMLEKVSNWQDGSLIQREFPELTSEQREIIKSGRCDEAWRELFGEEDLLLEPGDEEDGIPF